MTVTLIEAFAIPKYKEALNGYQSKFHYKPEVYESGVGDGAHVVWTNSGQEEPKPTEEPSEPTETPEPTESVDFTEETNPDE